MTTLHLPAPDPTATAPRAVFRHTAAAPRRTVVRWIALALAAAVAIFALA